MDASALRAKLRRLIEELPDLLEPAFDLDPLLAGRVYRRRYRCGKESCHCSQGEPHSYLSLATWGNGAKDVRSIPEEEAEKLRPFTDAYQRVREARAKFNQWHAKAVAIVDELTRLRTVPPKEGAPGRGKRSRKRKEARS